jgi:pimeloyl-ACP methyl ester carboxylesterase
VAACDQTRTPARGKALLLLLLTVLTACWQRTSELTAPTWTDPSPHHVGFVTVSPSVRLHYLDWGGTGEPLVFLAGLGNSAHSFDDFAPLFTDRFHVVALTRRGQGESSRPTGPYDISTLTEDIRVLLDSLHFAAVNLAGHSFAGQELTHFALTYPQRVRRLVYLDAAFDYVEDDSLLQQVKDSFPSLPGGPPSPSRQDCESPSTYSAYADRVAGAHLPAGEIHYTFIRLPDGSCTREGLHQDSIQTQMMHGNVRQEWDRLVVPRLAIFAVRDSLSQEAVWIQEDSLAKANYLRATSLWEPFTRAMRLRFARSGGQLVEIHGAQHWLYASDQGRVYQVMRAFLLSSNPMQ